MNDCDMCFLVFLMGYNGPKSFFSEVIIGHQPKQCTIIREIPQNYHAFAACLIPPKRVPFLKWIPCTIIREIPFAACFPNLGFILEKATLGFIFFINRQKIATTVAPKTIIPKTRPKFGGNWNTKKHHFRDLNLQTLDSKCEWDSIRIVAPKWIYENTKLVNDHHFCGSCGTCFLKKNHSHIVLPCLIGYRILDGNKKQMLSDNILETWIECQNFHHQNKKH